MEPIGMSNIYFLGLKGRLSIALTICALMWVVAYTTL